LFANCSDVCAQIVLTVVSQRVLSISVYHAETTNSFYSTTSYQSCKLHAFQPLVMQHVYIMISTISRHLMRY